MTTPVLSQSHFRGRAGSDAANSAAAFWIAGVDTSFNWTPNTPFRVRFTIQETAGGNPAAQTVKLQSQLNAAAFIDVTTTSSNVTAVSASVSPDETLLTLKQLTGTGTYVSGRYASDGLTTNSVDLGASGNTEYEFGIQITDAHVAVGNTVKLRVVALAGTAITATVIPTITVQKTFGWWFDWANPPVLAKKGLRTNLQQTTAISPAALLLAEQVTESRWHQAWSEPVRFRLAQHPAWSFVYTEVAAVTVDSWFQSLSQPRAKAKLLSEVSQVVPYFALPELTQAVLAEPRFKSNRRYGDTAVEPVLVPTVETDIGWYADFSAPKRRTRAPTGEAVSPPQVTVAPATGDIGWFNAMSIPVARQHGLATMQVISSVIPVDEEGPAWRRLARQTGVDVRPRSRNDNTWMRVAIRNLLTDGEKSYFLKFQAPSEPPVQVQPKKLVGIKKKKAKPTLRGEPFPEIDLNKRARDEDEALMLLMGWRPAPVLTKKQNDENLAILMLQ